MGDDYAVGFLDGVDDRSPIVRRQRAQIDDLDADALLFSLFRGDNGTVDQRAVGDDLKILAFAYRLRFSKRDHKIVRWILRFVVGLAIEMFVFQKHHRIVAANRCAQQTVRIKRVRRIDDAQTGDLCKRRNA